MGKNEIPEIKRYQKENIVLEYLESLKELDQPIKIGKYKTIIDIDKFIELHSERIKHSKHQSVYNNSIQEIGVLKKQIEKGQ